MTRSGSEQKIYLTYKTRMTTEARLRRIAFITQAIVTWYSIVLIVLSLLDLTNKFSIANFSLISASASIVMLAASMFIYGERYSERADQFKNCYLKLKRLYESNKSTDAKMSEYADILELYDNQTDADYDNMIVNAFLRGQRLQNVDGDIKVGATVLIRVAVYRLSGFLLVAGLFIGPLVASAFWVQTKTP